MNEVQIAAAVVGLTQIVKMNKLPSKYLPIIAVVLGIALNLVVEGLSVISGMKGLIIGLSATGLVNRTDHYINGRKKKRKPVKFATKAINEDKPNSELEKEVLEGIAKCETLEKLNGFNYENDALKEAIDLRRIELTESAEKEEKDQGQDASDDSEGGGEEKTVPTTPQ